MAGAKDGFGMNGSFMKEWPDYYVIKMTFKASLDTLGRKFAAFSKIWPRTRLSFTYVLSFVLWTNFHTSSKSRGLVGWLFYLLLP